MTLNEFVEKIFTNIENGNLDGNKKVALSGAGCPTYPIEEIGQYEDFYIIGNYDGGEVVFKLK